MDGKPKNNSFDFYQDRIDAAAAVTKNSATKKRPLFTSDIQVFNWTSADILSRWGSAFNSVTVKQKMNKSSF